MQKFNRVAKLVAVTTLGGALLVAGIAMLVLPGPGLLVAIAGLAVLAIEYAWARKLRDEAKRRVDRMRRYRRAHKDDPAQSAIVPDGPAGGSHHHHAA